MEREERMMNELEPCPFCGSTEVYVEEYEHHPGAMRWRVLCVGCMAGIDTGTRQSASAAVQDWNLRAERTCHIKLSKTSVWHCDGCGQTIDGNCFADNGGRLIEYRYCPNCGAKVVDE